MDIIFFETDNLSLIKSLYAQAFNYKEDGDSWLKNYDDFYNSAHGIYSKDFEKKIKPHKAKKNSSGKFAVN